MKNINTSDCEGCQHGTLIKVKNILKVQCSDKDKTYYYGQYVPCDNYTKRKKDDG